MSTLKQNLLKGMLALFTLGLIACGNNSKEGNPEQKIVTVKTIQVQNLESTYQREYIGTIESNNSVDLSFQVNGNIEEIFVQEGQAVQKGQLLARLNTHTLESTYRVAKATLNQTQDAFDRLSKLYNNNSLPEVKYIEAKSNLEQAQANERIAKKNFSECNLYAPFSGVIGQRNQEIGANVMPGSPIFNLMSIGNVKVRIAIPENDISSIKIGENCVVKITALDNASFEGKVIEKGVVAHPVSHTYDIKVQLDNQKKDIMPGMVCKAYLINKERKGGIIVPLKTVQVESSGKNYVWLVDGNKAEYKAVKIGELIGNGIVIEEGLKDGDILITEGYQNLSPGISVKSI
ncbi:MAG: efflux RND transporter periplasmic adaptor subunit [Prevotella sp.]|jgi:RND family efflux transporter MFP subunit|nr:efflux RND transporter periplasmic adaptor subunit [Prevotella sp.]